MGLAERNYVKIICAAGNENALSVHNIALLYTYAGADCIDVAANPGMVGAAKSGIEKGRVLAAMDGVTREAPTICVSVGIEGDQHVLKARINPKYKNDTGFLKRVCPMNAIVGWPENGEPIRVIEEKCIGCGNCVRAGHDAIMLYSPARDLTSLVPKCISAGASMVELHANVGSIEEVERSIAVITSALPVGFVSLCLGRGKLSEDQVRERIQLAQRIVGERLIVQADGNPMSGVADSANTTLQAIAMGDFVAKMKDAPLVILSGGTNQLTARLAQDTGVPINGIAFGSNARKIVAKQIGVSDLMGAGPVLDEGLKAAKDFVAGVKRELHVIDYEGE